MDIFSALIFSFTFSGALSLSCFAVKFFVSEQTAKGFGPGGLYYDCAMLCILIVGCSLFGVFDFLIAGVIYWALGVSFVLLMSRIARALGLRKAPAQPLPSETATPTASSTPVTEAIEANFRVVS